MVEEGKGATESSASFVAKRPPPLPQPSTMFLASVDIGNPSREQGRERGKREMDWAKDSGA